jgi:hypothetical protein
MQKYKRIKLTKNKYALIDSSDYNWLSKYNWHYFRPPHARTGYALTKSKILKNQGNVLRMHTLIMGFGCDHKNNNGLDNRRLNLRKATKRQQAYNQSKRLNKKSKGCKGVSIVKNWKGIPKYWIARITVKGNRIYLGTFKNHISASRAYIKAAKKYHGEFARWK